MTKTIKLSAYTLLERLMALPLNVTNNEDKITKILELYYNTESFESMKLHADYNLEGFTAIWGAFAKDLVEELREASPEEVLVACQIQIVSYQVYYNLKNIRALEKANLLKDTSVSRSLLSNLHQESRGNILNIHEIPYQDFKIIETTSDSWETGTCFYASNNVGHGYKDYYDCLFNTLSPSFGSAMYSLYKSSPFDKH